MNLKPVNVNLDVNVDVNVDVNIVIYTGETIIKKNIDVYKFVEIIYKNFEELSEIPKLEHSKENIYNIITNQMSVMIIGIHNNKISSYLIGKTTFTEIYGNVMHIHYLFTGPMFRQKGLSTFSLNTIQKYARNKNIKYLTLTFDTYNKSLEKFYIENYFRYEPSFRTYDRYDVLIKDI
jgi:RimJ/RimL family protein N-acetyltransferase